MRTLLTFVILSVLSACNQQPAGDGLEGARPGWTLQLAHNLIGCRPIDSRQCKCVNKAVTEKYLPEEIRQPAVYVSNDLIRIFNGCSAPQSEQSPQPPQQGSGKHPGP